VLGRSPGESIALVTAQLTTPTAHTPAKVVLIHCQWIGVIKTLSSEALSSSAEPHLPFVDAMVRLISCLLSSSELTLGDSLAIGGESCIRWNRYGMLKLGLAHGGSYSIYYALAIASKEVQLDHRWELPFLYVS
jgi:hypothetical protein